jgi:hypothetical protein
MELTVANDNFNPDLETALDEAEVTIQAKLRKSQTDSYQGQVRAKHANLHQWYRPADGDQWPDDRSRRPGAVHITHNVIQPGVDTEARLESLIPRCTLIPTSPDEETANKAEAIEKMMLFFLEDSGWETWLPTLNKSRGIYGKGAIKVFWNEDKKQPDCRVLEIPSNLRFGWGSSDFSVIDWAMYEYSLSPTEALRQFPEIEFEAEGRGKALLVLRSTGDHADPLETISPTNESQARRNDIQGRVPDGYEDSQVDIWDYWYKDEHNVVRNARFVQGALATKIVGHPELRNIPYIPVEFDHELGSPEGMSLVEGLVDVQYEINRALSHWVQLIRDNLDPAWQMNVDAVPAGIVPNAGEIIATGEGNTKINPIEKPVNQFPIAQLLQELYRSFHFNSGLSEILFSLPPGAQTAGRALAIQIEASANRIDPRRRLLYNALKQLLEFWSFMLEKKNPKVTVTGPDGQPIEVGVGDMLKGQRRWKFVAPEITPRDVIEATTNVINKVQAKLVSLEAGMDELGVDSPLEMKRMIEQERTNAALFPGDTQAYAAVQQLLLQIAQQMQQAQAAQGGQAPGEAALGQLQAAGQAAQPTLNQENNQGGPAQPMTQPGSPAPAGGPVPGNQTLIRSQPTGGAVALQQIAIRPQGAQ